MSALKGSCHCGNVEFTLLTEQSERSLAPRRCGCSMCRRHGASWISDPNAQLELRYRDPSRLGVYQFGHATSRWILCARCGVLTAAICKVDGRLRAVVRSQSMIDHQFSAPEVATDIDAGIRVQSARADEALLAWQKSVLVAVQEVEDSLLVRTEEAERAAALAHTVDHRRSSLQRARSLQREGQIDLLVLLDVQRSVLASELALSDSRLQQVLADVQLYKALGGGFAPARAGAAMTSLAQRTPQ